MVEYFYHEANRRNGANPDGCTIPESAFRYPGPKPQTREAAILMVAGRPSKAPAASSPNPPPLVSRASSPEMIDKRLHDGQFDECGLTLKEIAEVRDSLIKSLIGIYHGRVKYPEHRTASA